MKGKNIAMFLAGTTLGAAVLGPAAAAGISAIKSAQAVYVDGQKAALEAYSINDTNYVKLRDVGELLDVNVYWDGSAVQIDTGSPYTGEAPATAPAVPVSQSNGGYTIHSGHWSREDYSQQANPAVFTGPYTRELYNAIRQTIVDQGTDKSAGTNCAYCMVSKADHSAVKNVIGRLEGVLRYEHYVPTNFTNYYEYLDYFAVSARMPENYKDAYEYIQPVISKVNSLGTDREKVTYLNDYLCTLLTYQKEEYAGIADTFSPHNGELKANCGSYAKAFKFLCAAAGIPCVTITTENHGWNLVYADGQWLHADVSNNDVYNQHYILLTETVNNRIDTAPYATEFIKELMVPGSTKT